ncbi:hypothetical protein ACA910_001583 [Epithemia clementina (nom. ined.)]
MGQSRRRNSDADNDKDCDDEKEENNKAEGHEERKFGSSSSSDHSSRHPVIVSQHHPHPRDNSSSFLLQGELSQESASFYDDDDLSQRPELRIRTRRHVHAVIQQCLSPHQSKAYMEAMEKCPKLVFQETDPLQFVRYCKYDGTRLTGAAQRLCSYWTERKRLFGSQKAFLPLALVKSAALDEDDLVTLRAAFPAMLFPTICGLQCFFLEPKWKVVGTSMDNVLRSCFYLFTTMAEDDRTQVEGIHFLLVISTPRGPEVDWNFLHRVFYLMAKVFPVRLQKLHLIGIPQQRRPSAVVDLMENATNIVGEYRKQDGDDGAADGSGGDWLPHKSMIQVHLESKPKTILDNLLKEGLTARGIPLSLGGEWSLRDCSQWCRERMMMERSCQKIMQNWHHQDQRALSAGCMDDGVVVTRAGASAVSRLEETAAPTAAPSSSPPPPPPPKEVLAGAGAGLLAGGHQDHPPAGVLCCLSASSAFEAVGTSSRSNSNINSSTTGRSHNAQLLFASRAAPAAAAATGTTATTTSIIGAGGSTSAPTTTAGEPPTTAAAVPNLSGGGSSGGSMLGGGLSLASSPTTAAAVAAAAGRRAAAAFFHESALSATPPPSDPESEHEKVAKRRMGNLISSRRKRERQREHIRLLKEESSHLTSEHERLLREQTRLQALHREIQEQLLLCRGLLVAAAEEEHSEHKNDTDYGGSGGSGVIMI